MTEYEVVWAGRGPLTRSEGWIQKRTPLINEAPGNGLLTNNEMRGRTVLVGPQIRTVRILPGVDDIGRGKRRQKKAQG